MRIELVRGGDFIKVVSNVNEETYFDSHLYKPARIEQSGDIFRTVNEFLARLPPTSHAALFGLYVEAKDTFMTARHEEVLDARLTNVVRRIFNLIDLSALRSYVELYSGILIPSDIKSSYTEVEAGFMRDKTYIREEYIDLLTFAVASRFCLPIWGEYMSHIEGLATSDGKEYHTYQLIRESQLVKQEACRKLVQYVTASMTNSIETASSTLSGVGRNQIPEWLAAMVIVRKLPVIDLYGLTGKNNNIINLVFNYVNSHLTRLAKRFMDNARERRNDTGGGDDEKDQTYIETYRAKQETSYAQLETNIVYLENDLALICKDIDPTFNPEIVSYVEEVSKGLETALFHQHNFILTQWVLDKAISTLQPDIMERRIAVRSMLVAQSLLHHWGLHHLALLATGIRVPQSNKQVLGDRLAKLTTEQYAKLEEIYPFTLPKSKNYGFISVMEMANELTRYQHAVRVPRFLTTKDVRTDRYGHMHTPPTITHELAELLIKLDEIA